MQNHCVHPKEQKPQKINHVTLKNSLGRAIFLPSVFSNLQEMVGAGYPLASQSRVKFAPIGP